MITIEYLIIMVLAFIIIGPKDFPRLMFRAGDLLRRLKFFGAEFYDHMETLAEDAKDGPKGIQPSLPVLAPQRPPRRKGNTYHKKH